MKRRRTAFLAAALAACLAAGAASAGVTGLDETLSTYLDLNDDVRCSFGIELKTLMPFGDATIEMMNATLRHIRADAWMREGAVDLQLSVDGESVLTMTEARGSGGSELQTSLLPNRTLTSSGSAMDRLSGNEAGKEAPFDALRAVAEAEECYKALTDAIIPYAEEKKANYKIKNIGASKWSRVARLTVEQSAELAPLIAEVLGCGMDAAYRARLEEMTYAKGFVIALYQSAQDGKDMAVYMKGGVSFPEGESYKLAYQWAFDNEGTERKDTYKFELVKSKSPADNRVIAASYAQKLFTDHFSVSGKSEITLKNADGAVATTVQHDLSGQEQEGVRSLKGTQSETVKTTADGETETTVTTLAPDVALTSAEGSGVLSGTVTLEEKRGKNVLTSMVFSFDAAPAQALTAAADSGALYAVSETPTPAGEEAGASQPQSSLIQNEEELDEEASASDYLVGKAPVGLGSYTAPQSMQTIDLDQISGDQRASLMGELSQNLAGRLLIALYKLPEEDTALLRDHMSEEDYAAFLELVNSL